MSVKIRLSKTGKKHQISFRIIACDTHTKRDGKFLEILGHYYPHTKNGQETRIDNKRLDYWIQKGAKPTQGVTKLISQNAKGLTTNAEIEK